MVDVVEVVRVSNCDVKVESVVEGVVGGEVDLRQRCLNLVEFDEIGAVVDGTTDAEKKSSDGGNN